jgi:hypothetical protein
MYRFVMNTVFARRQVDAFRKIAASLSRKPV